MIKKDRQSVSHSIFLTGVNFGGSKFSSDGGGDGSEK